MRVIDEADFDDYVDNHCMPIFKWLESKDIPAQLKEHILRSSVESLHYYIEDKKGNRQPATDKQIWKIKKEIEGNDIIDTKTFVNILADVVDKQTMSDLISKVIEVNKNGKL